MRKSRKPQCDLCGRELGSNFKKIILRDVETRGNSQQMFTLGEMNICEGCKDRFDDFQERCRLSADE